VAEHHAPSLADQYTMGSTDPALHQIKITACGKLTIANHPLELHTV